MRLLGLFLIAFVFSFPALYFLYRERLVKSLFFFIAALWACIFYVFATDPHTGSHLRSATLATGFTGLSVLLSLLGIFVLIKTTGFYESSSSQNRRTS